MKLTNDRPYSDPEKAVRRLMEHAHAFEPSQDGRIYIEKINEPFLFPDKGSPARQSRPRPCYFAWLAGTARERNVREANAERR